MINPTVNPVYRTSSHNGRWRLTKQMLDSDRGETAPGDNVYLPEAVSLEMPLLDRQSILMLKASDLSTFAKLTRQFVFIDVPEQFQ